MNEGKIAELQSRIQDLQREQQIALNQQNKFFGALQSNAQTAAPAQVTNPTQSSTGSADRSDSGRTEEEGLSVALFFQCGVELQKGTRRAGIGSERRAPNTNPFGLQSLPAPGADFNQQLSQILQGLPAAMQPTPPAPPVAS